jgi:hypothetical protein
MLETVDVGTQDLDLYEGSVGAEAVAQLRELAAPLEHARILHVNATPYGGGVAEILRSEIPLLRDLGLLADWISIPKWRWSTSMRDAPIDSARRLAVSSSRRPLSPSCGLLHDNPNHQLWQIAAVAFPVVSEWCHRDSTIGDTKDWPLGDSISSCEVPRADRL